MKTLLLLLALSSSAAPAKKGAAVPQEARRHFVRGATFQKEAKNRADFEKAASEFLEAVNLAPAWPEARYNHGVALESAGKFADAKKAFEDYIALKPRPKDADKVQDKIFALEAKAEKALTALAGKWWEEGAEVYTIELIPSAGGSYTAGYEKTGGNANVQVSTKLLDFQADAARVAFTFKTSMKSGSMDFGSQELRYELKPAGDGRLEGTKQISGAMAQPAKPVVLTRK